MSLVLCHSGHCLAGCATGISLCHETPWECPSPFSQSTKTSCFPSSVGKKEFFSPPKLGLSLIAVRETAPHRMRGNTPSKGVHCVSPNSMWEP